MLSPLKDIFKIGYSTKSKSELIYHLNLLQGGALQTVLENFEFIDGQLEDLYDVIGQIQKKKLLLWEEKAKLTQNTIFELQAKLQEIGLFSKWYRRKSLYVISFQPLPKTYTELQKKKKVTSYHEFELSNRTISTRGETFWSDLAKLLKTLGNEVKMDSILELMYLNQQKDASTPVSPQPKKKNKI